MTHTQATVAVVTCVGLTCGGVAADATVTCRVSDQSRADSCDDTAVIANARWDKKTETNLRAFRQLRRCSPDAAAKLLRSWLSAKRSHITWTRESLLTCRRWGSTRCEGLILEGLNHSNPRIREASAYSSAHLPVSVHLVAPLLWTLSGELHGGVRRALSVALWRHLHPWVAAPQRN